MILFIISMEGEDVITPHIAGGVHFPMILFVISKGGRPEDINPYIAGDVHPPVLLSAICSGERMMLLPISQGM